MSVRDPKPLTQRGVKLKTKRIMKQNFLNDDQEMRYILRQIGFGAVLGAAFLCVVYFGGLLAQCVGNF